MKSLKTTVKILSLLLVFVLAGCSSAPVLSVDNQEWRLQTAAKLNSKTEDYTLIARSSEWNTDDETVHIADIVLSAKDGVITVTDRETQKTYTGTYKKSKSSQNAGTIYEIRIENLSGYGTAAFTEYGDGTKIPTFPLTLIDGDIQYALYFQAKA